MPIITRILEHPRRAGRFAVEVDGTEVAVVGAETLGALKLQVRDEVTARHLGALEAAAIEWAVYDRALNLLAVRSRSVRELRRRLLQKEPNARAVDAALARLERAGLMDDASYAVQVAQSKLVTQGASRRRVRQELFKRGVSGELADAAIDRVVSEEAIDESALVERAARKRARLLGSLDPATKRRRLYGFLARRGYESEDIVRALAAVLGGDASDARPDAD
jgi:regulatory protein